jgi:hypothetical protein
MTHFQHSNRESSNHPSGTLSIFPSPQSSKSSPSLSSLLHTAATQTDPQRRAEILRHAGTAAGKGDIAESLRLARDLDSMQDRLDFHRGLFGEWAEHDPVAALNHARDNFLPGALQSETIGIVINKWGADHPHEAWLWSNQNLSGPLKERALTDLMVGWTRRTPDIASSWLTDSGLTSQSLINAVGRTWAEQDPKRAAAWAKDLPLGIPQQTAQVAVASEWAAQNPEEAAEHFTEAVSEKDGVHLAIAITDVWATTDPAATAQWLSKLPDSASRDQSAGALATIWAASDITAAVAWSTSLTDARMREQVIAHVGTSWGAIEPLEAIDWLTSLPRSEANDGITGAFYSWAGTAPEQLQEWIAQNPPADLGDRARLSLGDVLTSSDLPSAMELALGMHSAKARNESVSRFFREWRKSDDPGAQDWLDANWNSLSPEAQARLNQEQAREFVPR